MSEAFVKSENVGPQYLDEAAHFFQIRWCSTTKTNKRASDGQKLGCWGFVCC